MGHHSILKAFKTDQTLQSVVQPRWGMDAPNFLQLADVPLRFSQMDVDVTRNKPKATATTDETYNENV